MKVLICLLLVSVLATLFTDSLSAATKVYFETFERQITTDTADQFDPSICGTIIVYSDRRNSDADVYIYDLAADSEIQVTSGGGDQLLTDVWDNHVVYTDYGSGNAEIFLRYPSGSYASILSHPANQRRPAINDGVIVFEDDRNGNYDCYWYISTTLSGWVTLDLSHQRKPAVADSIIVYEDFRNGNSDVGMYRVGWSTEMLLTDDPAQDVDPDINDGIIAFCSNRADIGDVFYFDIAADSLVQVTAGDGNYERNPSVSGDFITYESYAAGDADIWLYSILLDSSVRITCDSAEQYLHDHSGNTIVYTDNRNGNLDIYAMTFLFEEVVCGDANGDDIVNVGDAIFLINYIFKAGPEPLPKIAGDASCDEELNVGDAIYIINYVFNGGPEPCCP